MACCMRLPSGEGDATFTGPEALTPRRKKWKHRPVGKRGKFVARGAQSRTGAPCPWRQHLYSRSRVVQLCFPNLYTCLIFYRYIKWTWLAEATKSHECGHTGGSLPTHFDRVFVMRDLVRFQVDLYFALWSAAWSSHFRLKLVRAAQV